MKVPWLLVLGLGLSITAGLYGGGAIMDHMVAQRHSHVAAPCQKDDEGEFGVQHRIPIPDWQQEPPPVHRTESPNYWQMWCRSTWGTEISRPGARQRSLDWADHCTEVGDANGR